MAVAREVVGPVLRMMICLMQIQINVAMARDHFSYGSFYEGQSKYLALRADFDNFIETSVGQCLSRVECPTTVRVHVAVDIP